MLCPIWGCRYVYRLDEDDMDGSKLGISPQTQTISNNLVFNFNFHGQSCGSIAIDFDDETSQMNVTENVLVYGAIKTFDGMDRCAPESRFPGLPDPCRALCPPRCFWPCVGSIVSPLNLLANVPGPVRLTACTFCVPIGTFRPMS